MKTVMVIPTYWARESATGWQPGDAVYDHPTPIDQEGTLRRGAGFARSIREQRFLTAYPGLCDNTGIEEAVEERVSENRPSKQSVRSTPMSFSHSHLRDLQAVIAESGNEELADILSLTGYANIRNMCLFVPYVLGAEVVVLIDDDEIFDDPQFMEKAGEFIGRRFMGQTIDGVAGYYVNSSGSYYDDVPDEIHWMTYWDRFGSKREAFDQVISENRA